MKNYYLVSIVLIMICRLLNAQVTPVEMQDANDRINNLEAAEKLRDKDLDLKKQELHSQIAQELKDAKEEIKDSNKLLTMIGLPATIIGIIGLWLSAIWYVNDKHRKFVDGLSKGKVDTFNQAIALQEFENKVKAQKKILVISVGQTEEKELQGLLAGLGFKDPERVKFLTTQTYQQPGRYHLIVFNDIEKKLTGQYLQLMKDYWGKCGDEQMFLAYTTGQGQIPTHSRMNFANSQFTLYQQILTTIRVGELLHQA